MKVAESAQIVVRVHGQRKQVSALLLKRELLRSGPPPTLVLIEAILQHAERGAAIARLRDMLKHIPEPLPAEGHHVVVRAAQGLMQLGAADEDSLAVLRALAQRLGGDAGAAVEAGVVLLSAGPAGLVGASGRPLRQAARALCVLLLLPDPAGPRPATGPATPVVLDLLGLSGLTAAWLQDMRRQHKALGVHALRGYLGDVAEALYRLARRGIGPRQLLSEADCGYLMDLTTGELPGTSEFLAARPMVWLLPLLGALDDAGVAAIERARDRFANEEFHADCAQILAGQPWPPVAPDRLHT